MQSFTIDIPDSALHDLRDRLARTRWPEQATVAGWAQGVPLEYARELVGYWADGYDWRRCEAESNTHPQFTTPLDGGGDDPVEIHLIHQRSPHPDAMPLLLTHGWPGSVVEFLDIIDALTDPPDPRDAFHVVAPSLPGYGWSGKPAAAGWGVERIVTAWTQLMERLGYRRFAAAGGDWGSVITAFLGAAAPDVLHGIHLTMPVARAPQGRELTPDERAAAATSAKFQATGSGYSAIQSTKPQTVGYGLADSPVGQCMWIVEKFFEWTDCDGHPENAISRDRMLDNVMHYWLPGAGASSARLYWESFGLRRVDEVRVPTGVTLFPHEMVRLPRPWVETRFTDLRYWSEAEKGGHFASLEQPQSYVHELRTFFRTLR